MTATERKQYIAAVAQRMQKKASYSSAISEIESEFSTEKAEEISEVEGISFNDYLALGNGNFRKYIEAVV